MNVYLLISTPKMKVHKSIGSQQAFYADKRKMYFASNSYSIIFSK